MDRKNQLPPTIDIPKEEIKTLNFWKDADVFQMSLKQSVGKPRYTFYDGPPFATGLPHYGHLLAGTIKDIITRYAHQKGHYVERRFGWDCHGLPVEYEVDKENGITGPLDVEKMGISSYNEKCRSIVMRHSSQWEVITNRLGRWVDFSNDYRTMYPWFMESVWWVFKQLFDKGLVYRGLKVMPFSTACSTPLSNFEAGQNYRDVQDPAVIITFPLDSDPKVELVAWTTTPWTLPSNLSLCVHPDKDYVKLRDLNRERIFVLMKARLSSLYKSEDQYQILDTFKGQTLVGQSYEPIFDCFIHLKKERGAFRVLSDTYVTEDAGTGVVQQAPYFGEDDFRVCLTYGIISKDSPMICPIDSSGKFTDQVKQFDGLYIKDADKLICQDLKQRNRLVHHGTITHSYPFCWRSDTPLIYKSVPTWFIRVEKLVDRLLENNSKCIWVPDFVREGRFANWLRDARDWAVSRNRYWGTPIPIWISDDMEEVVCIGSIDELEKLSGIRLTDLHKEFVDPITIPSRTGRGTLKRITEVFDCWFESGSMPYAQLHYPFENTKAFEEGFPADFIAEGIDQTRGWFYTLLVLSTALFDKPPFKNLIVNGIVLASDGQKMSKRSKNYPNPSLVLEKYGADPLRLYLINSPVVRAQNLRFTESGIHDVVKDVFLPWYNALRFLIESSITPFERLKGQRFMVKPDSCPQTNNFMDRWILSFTQSLILFVHKELASYRLFTVVPCLVKFIDHLVNWYVRMNRKRLKGDSIDSNEDWLSALHTLFKVIYQIVLLMSPFTPFMSEYLYQNLKSRLDFTDNLNDRAGLLPGFCSITGAPESVHYLSIPKPCEDLISREIEEIVEWMQATIDLGRVIRTRSNLPIKAPLREAVAIHSDPLVLDKIKAAQAYIVKELNVRHLTVTGDKHRYGVQLKGILNHRTLGSKFKQSYKAITMAMKDMPTSELEKFLTTGRLIVSGQELSGDDLSVVYTTASSSSSSSSSTTTGNNESRSKLDVSKCKSPKANSDHPQKQQTEEQYKAESNAQGLLILLDTTPDADLDHERLARELTNRIQRTRKKANIVPEETIVVVIRTNESDDFYHVAGPQGQYIDLVQSIIKQPMVIWNWKSSKKSDSCYFRDQLEAAESVLPSDWTLGLEMFSEVTSIPPYDDIELVLFRRHLITSNISPTNQGSSPNYGSVVHIVNLKTKQTCDIRLQDLNKNILVQNSRDLLRKVRCVFGWAESTDLLFYQNSIPGSTSLTNQNQLIPFQHLGQNELHLLWGTTLYLTVP